MLLKQNFLRLNNRGCMKKTSYIVLNLIFCCVIIAISFFVLLDFFENNGKNYFWVFYFIAIFLYLIVLMSAKFLNKKNKNNFYNELKDNNFLLDVTFQYDNQIICIDFKNKKMAFSEIDNNYIFDFSDFKGGILETLEVGNKIKVYYYISLQLVDDTFELFHITILNKTFYCQNFISLETLAEENVLLQNFLNFKEKLDLITEYNKKNNNNS